MKSFEHLIDGVQVMVAILTGSVRNGVEHSDYFTSVPCQIELNRARENGTLVVFVIESAPAYIRNYVHHSSSEAHKVTLR